LAYKQFELDGVGNVTIYKRRGARSVRLTVGHDGKVKVSMPTWLPYKSGLSYAESKRAWLQDQLSQRTTTTILDGQIVGKQHRLRFEADSGDKLRTRILKSGDILVYLPAGLDSSHQDAQLAATKASIRALRAEAEELLPARLRRLADQHGLPYRSFGVKQLKGRWGSCDQAKHITINLYAMQLPWELIDYILLHELAHTKYLNHSADFWALLTELDPDAHGHRKLLRTMRPVISGA